MKLSLNALFDTQPDPEWAQILLLAGAEDVGNKDGKTNLRIENEIFIIEHKDEPASTMDILLNAQNIPQEIDTSWTVPLLGHNAHVTITAETENPMNCARMMLNIAAQMNPEAVLWFHGALIDSVTLRAVQSGDAPDTVGLFALNEWTDEQNVALVATGTYELTGQHIIWLDPIENEDDIKNLTTSVVYLLENTASEWPTSLQMDDDIEIGITKIGHLTLLKRL